MKKQETIFDYLGQAFQLFGITVIMLLVIALVLGDQTKGVTVMFSLGDDGLPTAILFQFFVISIVITCINWLFFTDKWIKTGSKLIRTVAMLSSVVILMAIVIYLFDWFPMNSLLPWLLFFCFFFISFGASVVLVYWKEKMENKQMEEGLKRVKAQLEEGSNDSDH